MPRLDLKITSNKLIKRFKEFKIKSGLKTNTSVLSLLLTAIEDNERLRKENELLQTKKALEFF